MTPTPTPGSAADAPTGAPSSGGPPPAVRFRRARPGDAAAAARIVPVALNDLYARQGRTRLAEDEGCAPVFVHLAADPGASFWLAEADEGLVGLGLGLRRSDLWFLGGLFVAPAWQGRGVGRALLERAQGNRAPGGRAAVLSSASNEVSNRLYASCGMLPQLAVLELRGPLPLVPQPALPRALRPGALTGDVAGLAALRSIDAAVLGIDRTADHRWLLGEAKRPGRLFTRSGRPVAYAYLGGDGTLGADAVGPMAAVRPADVAPVVAWALGELAARGASAGAALVPGANLAAQRLLWGAGFRFHEATALFGADRPFERLDRYCFAGDALM